MLCDGSDHTFYYMGSSGPSAYVNTSGSHTQKDETNVVIANYKDTVTYNDIANNALQNIYKTISVNQDNIRNEAIQKELRYFIEYKDIELQIYTNKVAIAQAKYVSQMYVNKIIAELKILRSILAE